MKRILFIALFLATSFTYGQTFGVLFENKVVNTGDTLEFSVAQNNAEIEVYFDIVNKIDSTVNAMAARENVDVVEGSDNFFCFGNCFDSKTDTCAYSIEIAGLDTLEGEFSTHYSHRGNAGTSIVKYSVFVENDLNDITYFYVRYNTYVGIKNNNLVNVSLNAYPNPATETVTVSYQLPENNNNTYFVIKNLVGKTVYSTPVSHSNDKMKVNLSDLSAGIYFYSLEQNSKSLITKKLIVK